MGSGVEVAGAGASRSGSVAAVPGEMPPINTEQYGYNQLFVYEGFDVQVVISEMDTTCERHKGKTPR